jgi:hypothetical protein
LTPRFNDPTLHRVAISNHRLSSVENAQVTFTYRDRKTGNSRKSMTLAAEEFIRRFLLHVLPNGFMRIRHFGFLANRSKKQSLSRCRQLLGVSAPQANPARKSALELMRKEERGKEERGQIFRCSKSGSVQDEVS